MQTKYTLFAVLFALSIILGMTLQGTLPAQADGPSDTWQPSPAYLAARARLMNSKSQQLDRYMDTVERRGSWVVLSPQERYRAWKYREAFETGGSRYTPSVVPHK